MATRVLRSLLLALSCTAGALGGCADNAAPGAGGGDAGGGMDAAADGATEPDARASGEDGGGDAAGADGDTVDAGRGGAGACEACEADRDCAPGHYCVELMSGGRACLPSCTPEFSECPPRFDCVADYTAELPEPICAPVGERCCIDADGDLHGTGVGCLGHDCDDDDDQVHEDALELCDGVDNDCSGEVDDGDPAMMCPHGDHVAETSCGAGSCQIEACEPGFADCNGEAGDGCETSIGSETDCGACGEPCEPPNASGDCSSGACRVGECEPGWGNCDGSHATGCETPLDTLTDCGVCARACSLAHATEACNEGSCEIASCDEGWGDCDTLDDTGCETSLRTSSNCGMCDRICSPDRGTGDCSTGSCDLASCDEGWGNCDLDPSNGCETSLRTLSNCGSCGMGCSRPNAFTSCSTGACRLLRCYSGYSSCDSDPSNGCEVRHRSVAGACGGGTDVGELSGDRRCGFGCGGNTGWDLFATERGRTSAWLKARMLENSACPADIEHQITLDVPAGTNYDLYVYRSCDDGPTVSSTNGTGEQEAVVLRESESSGPDDGFDYYVEVRYVSGASCGRWTLRLYGHDC